MDVIGSSGTGMFRDHYGLQLGETEYNPKLRPPDSYRVYDEMRRSSGTVGGALRAINLPLIGATWNVEPGGPAQRDQEVADFVAENLLGGATSWVDTLRNILLFLPYGSMPFETVWEPKPWRGQTKVWLKHLAPRMPSTITRWIIDESDGLSLAGVVQETVTSGGRGKSIEVEIPAESLVVFVNDREGADWRGVSILRNAYRPWDFMKRLELVQAMGIERRNHGTDVGKLKGKVEKGGEEELAAKKALRSVHAHEKMHLIEYEDENGNGFTYRVVGVDGTVIPADTAIAHHRAEILRALCAETLGVGAEGTGSYALSTDKTSLFLQGLVAWGGIITETVNRTLIPRMVGVNFDGNPAMPRLVHSRLDTRDVTAVATAMQMLAGGQPILTVDDGIEDEARSMLELPAKAETRIFEGSRRQLGRRDGSEILPEVMAAIDAAEAQGVDVTLARQGAALFARAPRGGEWFMDLAKINRELDAGVERLVTAAAIYQSNLAESILEEVTLASEAGTLADLDPLKWDLPDDSETVEQITEALAAIAQRGYVEAQAEVRRQGLSVSLGPASFAIEGVPSSQQILEARARAYLAVVVQRMLAVGSSTALDAVAEGRGATEGLLATLTGLGDRFLRVEAGRTVSTANSIGRKEAQAEMADLVSHGEYTALLDGATCTECAAVDAQEAKYTVGSPEFERVYPPYRNCLGGRRCRCQMVLVASSEVTRTG